ncbi:MAG: hypothetical protein EOP02_31890, partial [Proteobacteria bacterium]
MSSTPNLLVHADYKTMCHQVAAQIAALVRRKPNAVLGLATGSTPIGVYDELIRLHREEGLDFSRVTCFNLDEYVPMAPESPQSYYHFMRQHLFDHINCQNWYVPSGLVAAKEVEAQCQSYEAMILEDGGLDFQLLGIGRSGHIGFNEPGSSPDSRTRLVALDSVTRRDAATDFFGLETVPAWAITMGIATILSAREIAILASGTPKAAIVAESVEGKVTSKVPASFLREHPNLDIDLQELPSLRIIQALRQGTDDLGIISDAVDTHGLQTLAFRDDPLVLIMPLDHPLKTANFIDSLQYD